MRDDDELTPEERAALDRLPRTETPSPAFEARVVAGLHDSGELRSGRRAVRLWHVAAAILIAIGGFSAGRLLQSDDRVPQPASAVAGQQYLLLLYGAATTTAEAERARVIEYGNWARAEASAGRLISGERLGNAQVAIGSAQFAPSSAQQPSGFFLIRASSFDEAAATAARCPHVRHGGTVVVRAVE